MCLCAGYRPRFIWILFLMLFVKHMKSSSAADQLSTTEETTHQAKEDDGKFNSIPTKFNTSL